MKIRSSFDIDTADTAVATSCRAGSNQVVDAVDALRQIDRHQARLLRAIAAARPEHGVPAERLISLAAKATGWDVAFLSRAVDTLSAMPGTWRAFDDGQISWSQLRGMVVAAQKLRVADRERLDVQIAGTIAQNDSAEPERLVEITQDLAGRIDDLAREERERAECEQSFIRFQPKLYGGVDFWGYADDETAAALTAALDAAADDPVADDADVGDADGNPIPAAWRRSSARGAQLIEALRRSAVAYQPGSSHGRTALSVIVDLQTLTGDGVGAITPRILWNLAGGRRATSKARVSMLACDSARSPVLVDGEVIVAAGDAHTIISTAMRVALVARDQGCRFPGCQSPAAHADAHHIIFREHDGPTELANLVLLCRPCHRLVHRHGWRLSMDEHGILTVSRGRYKAISRPRLRSPAPVAATTTARAGPRRGSTDPPGPASTQPSDGQPLLPF